MTKHPLVMRLLVWAVILANAYRLRARHYEQKFRIMEEKKMTEHNSQSPVRNIELNTIHGCFRTQPGSYDFFMVLNGEVEVLENGQRYYMYREDLILIGAGTDCGILATEIILF